LAPEAVVGAHRVHSCNRGVLVVLLAVGIVVDLRDRRRSGERTIRLPGWLERRGRGQIAAGPVYWGGGDFRPKSPREREDEQRNPAAKSDERP
jgi:hypothetical protein